MGAHSYSKSYFPENTKIGRYCSIGGACNKIPANHPLDRLSTCGLDYAELPFHPQGFRQVIPEEYKDTKLQIQIGNDVWIGNEALIKCGVKIGDGAVIGMRSIVTKDVPPYAIVAGTPAVIRRFRFSENIIERLINSKWFDYDPSCFSHLDTTNIEYFLDQFDELKSNGSLKLYNPKKVAIHEIFCPKDTKE